MEFTATTWGKDYYFDIDNDAVVRSFIVDELEEELGEELSEMSIFVADTNIEVTLDQAIELSKHLSNITNEDDIAIEIVEIGEGNFHTIDELISELKKGPRIVEFEDIYDEKMEELYGITKSNALWVYNICKEDEDKALTHLCGNSDILSNDSVIIWA